LIDTSHNGTVDFEEFKEGLKRLSFKEEELAQIFDSIVSCFNGATVGESHHLTEETLLLILTQKAGRVFWQQQILQDVDKSGQIQYTEFLAATLEARGYLEEERIAEAFQSMDRDSSGRVLVESCE
jgi:Ca2+-binding EF-hand superfamily protein